MQVFLRGRAVAAREHDALAWLDQRADGDPALGRIDAREVAHEIVASVGAGDRQRGVDVAADASQVARQQLADILLEDVERGAAVDELDHVLLGPGDAANRADRRAALRQAGHHGHAAREQHAGDAAFDDTVRNLRMIAARRGETADEKETEILRHGGDDFGSHRVARIAVHQSEVRLRRFQPAAILRAEGTEAAMHGLEHAIGIGRQLRRHDSHGGPVEVLGATLAAGGGDADAGGADPVGDAGAAAQQIERAFEMFGQPVGDIEEAEIGAPGQGSELVEAGLGGGTPVVVRGMGASECRHRAHPPAADFGKSAIVCRNTGSMRSTITLTPAALGWMPSS